VGWRYEPKTKQKEGEEGQFPEPVLASCLWEKPGECCETNEIHVWWPPNNMGFRT
jgi:hypothetical protein